MLFFSLIILFFLLLLLCYFVVFLITSKEKIDLKTVYAKRVGYLATLLSVFFFVFIFITLIAQFLSSFLGMRAPGYHVNFDLFNIFVLPPLYVFIFLKYIYTKNEESGTKTISIKGMWYSLATLIALVLILIGELFILRPVLQKLQPPSRPYPGVPIQEIESSNLVPFSVSTSSEED